MSEEQAPYGFPEAPRTPLVHQVQTEKHNCGQACVAMIAGCEIEEATRAMGKRGLTGTHHLVKGLAAFGIKTSGRLRVLREAQQIPHFCILKVSYEFRKNLFVHWIVHRNGQFYDPSQHKGKDGLTVPAGIFFKIISYLEILEGGDRK